MKLEHSFTVPTGIDEAWRILLDIEQIGPCLPGAAIDSVDGDDFTGSVKVMLGPVGLTYQGRASFVEKDAAAHRAVIDARGRDARGNGTAAAMVTAVLEAQDGRTLVKVDTDLDITGKPAQFGRGVMVDVGNKLIGQFADNLAATITSGGPAAQPPAPTPAAKRAGRPKPFPSTAESSGSAEEAPVTAGTGEPEEAVTRPVPPPREVEPVNLVESAGPAVAKRLAPVVATLLVLLLVRRRRARR